MTGTEKKTYKGYRLSRRTVREIDWLANWLDTTATAVIERAIDELYEKTRAGLRARLVPGEGGWYHLLIGDLPQVSVREEVLPKLGDHLEELLSEEGGPEELFSLVMLASAVVPGPMIIYHENIERLAGPEVYELIEQWEAEEAQKAQTPAAAG